MIVDFRQRLSDSPLVESVMHGFTSKAASVIRPAESCWHLVIVREQGNTHTIVTGPLPTSGVASWGEGGEILWIKFKLGVFMPHLPTRRLMDRETNLPSASRNTFWLRDASWQLPDFENADTFVDRLMKDELLTFDPLVQEVLKGGRPDVPPRTLRHRFLQATGLSHGYLQQMNRAQQAATLLEQGASIADTVFDLSYYDQPHLNRALKQFVGYTPGQILRASRLDSSTSL